MKKDDLFNKMSKFDYWFYSYDLGNGRKIEATEPKYRQMHYKKTEYILQPAINLLGLKDLTGLNILDCGCNSGFYSFECAKRSANYVLGLEGKNEFLEQAMLLREYYGFSNIAFKKMDVQNISANKVGQFDIVLLMGILYYLEDPITFMREISRIAKKDIIIDSEITFLDTALFRMLFFSDYPFKFGGLTKARLVPSVGAIKALLYLSGFRSFYILNINKIGPAYTNNRLALVASKEEREGFQLLETKPFHTTGNLVWISPPDSIYTEKILGPESTIKKENIKDTIQELQLQHSDKINTVYFHGYSMVPFLTEGDEIIVKHVLWDKIGLGDIITYRYEDKFPTYRVIEKKKDTLTLKPDNWPKIVKITKEEILGKVILRRRGKNILKYTNWRWILYSKMIVRTYEPPNPIKRFIVLKKDGVKRRLKKLLDYLIA